MNLRAAHHGYAYQDLIVGIALVDLLLRTAETITVDTKGFQGDRFDDLNITYLGGRRARNQVKHTILDRELSKDTFSADGRSLKLNKLLDSFVHDLAEAPGTTASSCATDAPTQTLPRCSSPSTLRRPR